MTIDPLAAATGQHIAGQAKTPARQTTPVPVPTPAVAAEPLPVLGTPGAAEPPPTAEALQAAVKQIDSYLKGSARSLQFKVDESTGRTVVSVRDANGEVIRQIPNEDVLRLARSLGASGSKSIVDIEV